MALGRLGSRGEEAAPGRQRGATRHKLRPGARRATVHAGRRDGASGRWLSPHVGGGPLCRCLADLRPCWGAEGTKRSSAECSSAWEISGKVQREWASYGTGTMPTRTSPQPSSWHHSST